MTKTIAPQPGRQAASVWVRARGTNEAGPWI
jgi:hypothetical protein